MILIPEKLKQKDFRFVLLKEKEKIPFEKGWEKKGYVYDDFKVLNHKGNLGIIGGHGGLRILDIDKPNKAKELLNKIKTLTTKTGSGGYHLYFISDYETNHVLKDGIGEIRANNYQAVIPNSIHPNGKKYEIFKDEEIIHIPSNELIELIKPYLKEEGNLVTLNSSIDISNSGVEFGEVCKLIQRGLTYDEINQRMSAFVKWKGATPQYRELTFKKAQVRVDDRKIIQPIRKDIQTWTFREIFKIKKNKNFIVQEVISPCSVSMFYSPPGHFKSLLLAYMGMSIASGKKWLGFKTKKSPVLYLDGENNLQMIRERTERFYKGHKLKRKNIPFTLMKNCLLMDSKKNIDVSSIDVLKNIIKEEKIKIIFFDTMHRFAFYDENSSDDINKLYIQVFKPLIEEFGLSIIFLHHTTKDGNYRGSGDFLGMVDHSYKITRTIKTDRFIISNGKGRGGEIENIFGEIDFGEDYTRVNKLDPEEEQEKELDKIKDLTNQIKEIFIFGVELRKKELLEVLDNKNYDYGSDKNVQRRLKFLRDTDFLDYDESKRTYRRIER